MPIDGNLQAEPPQSLEDGTPAVVPAVPAVPAPSEASPVVVNPTETSNYANQRGSAATVDKPAPAVATSKTRTNGGRRSRERSRSKGSEPAPAGSGAAAHIQLLQAQVQALNSRLSTLEQSHAEGHAAVRSFADRLVGENEKLDGRLRDMQDATGNHLAVIEDTFQRCDRAMAELKAASQAAVSAASHAAASPAGTASSAGLSPGLTRTDLNLLRTQVDGVAAEQLNHAERLVGMEDKFVAQEISVQSAVQEITSLTLIAVSQGRETESKRVAAEDVLRGEINAAVIQLQGGQCLCPAGCPGRTKSSPDEPSARLLQPSGAKDPFHDGSDSVGATVEEAHLASEADPVEEARPAVEEAHPAVEESQTALSLAQKTATRRRRQSG